MHTVIVSVFHESLSALAVTVEDSPTAMLMVQYLSFCGSRSGRDWLSLLELVARS
jgi:hypothetical protein